VRAEPSEAAKAPTPEVLPEPEPKEQEAPLTEADRHFLQAANAFETKDYDAAAEALQSGLALEPDNAVQQAIFGMVLSFQEAWAESAEAYRKALQIAPDNALFHLGLGVALHRQEQIEEAVDSLERAVELNPGLEEAHGLLGVWIHTVTTTKAWKGGQGILRASFFHENGRPVSGAFSNLVLADGQAAIEGPFTPPYRKTRYKDLHLFYPYKGLRIRKGDHRLKVQVELVDPTGKVLATRWASLTLEVIETAFGAVREARSSDVP
jgi:tetratricopeptide (TPR) repeat protein